jgi:hypothetical protein
LNDAIEIIDRTTVKLVVDELRLGLRAPKGDVRVRPTSFHPKGGFCAHIDMPFTASVGRTQQDRDVRAAVEEKRPDRRTCSFIVQRGEAVRRQIVVASALVTAGDRDYPQLTAMGGLRLARSATKMRDHHRIGRL